MERHVKHKQRLSGIDAAMRRAAEMAAMRDRLMEEGCAIPPIYLTSLPEPQLRAVAESTTPYGNR